MKITAVLSDTSDIVNLTLSDDIVITKKRLLYDEFVDVLNAAKKIPETRYSIPELPATYVAGDIVPSEKPTGTMSIFIKGAIQRMAYESGKDTIMVPFPSIVMVFKLANGILQKSMAFAVKKQNHNHIGRNTELYNYPYGNVSPYAGTVCWGLNVFRCFNTFKQLDMLGATFITSPTNADLYVGGQSVSKNISLPELVREQSKRKCFDETLLVSTGKTVGAIMKSN